MEVSMCFKIMSKVAKYTCRLHRYNYTHNQLNTRHFNIIFYEFFEGGGAKFKFAPGRQLPSLSHWGGSARQWNSLPKSIKCAASLTIFKKQLKTYLFTLQWHY